MAKYILIILILLILFSYRQLFHAWQSLYIAIGDYNKPTYVEKTLSKNKSTPSKDNQWEEYKKHRDEYFFTSLRKSVMEIESWEYYKKTFITKNGRVVDPHRDYITTSEGQGYAMRRALFMNDKVTFDKVYNWSKNNLQHKYNKLFSWLWGPKEQKKQGKVEYGVLDENSAPDACTEIAISLIFAAKVWGQKKYLDEALAILNDVWGKEVVKINGEMILVSGVNQNKTEIVEVNPSYFTPSRFRIFAEVDKKHDWQAVVDSSYRLTNWCVDNIPSGLPPDFFYMNRKTGEIFFKKDKSDFSYDAVRVFYRFYVDYTLTRDPRAKNILSKSKIFINRWQHENKFYTNYKQSGELKDYDEAMGSISVLLPAMRLYDEKVADEIYKQKIVGNYVDGHWGDPLNYYAQNLIWFGNWLYIYEKNIRSFKY